MHHISPSTPCILPGVLGPRRCLRLAGIRSCESMACSCSSHFLHSTQQVLDVDKTSSHPRALSGGLHVMRDIGGFLLSHILLSAGACPRQHETATAGFRIGGIEEPEVSSPSGTLDSVRPQVHRKSHLPSVPAPQFVRPRRAIAREPGQPHCLEDVDVHREGPPWVSSGRAPRGCTRGGTRRRDSNW